MQKKLVLITMLLLVLCVVPVSAESLLKEVTLIAGESQAYNYPKLHAANATMFDGITKIEWEGITHTGIADYSCTGTISDGSTTYGNGSFLYHADATGTWTHATATWTFTDWNRKGKLGYLGNLEFNCASGVLQNWYKFNHTENYLDNYPADAQDYRIGIDLNEHTPNGTYRFYGTPVIPVGPPTADYTCNFIGGGVIPAYGNNPFGLACIDNSTANPAVSSVEWQLTNPDASVFTTTNASLVKTLTADGWYGLDFEACNVHGCGYKNTSQLINISSDYIPATGISFWATTYDPVKNAVIKPSEIYLQNLTSLAWRNVSSTGGISEFDSTDFAGNELLSVGQTVKLCGYAPGYTEACYNVTLPYSSYEYRINLASTSALPTGTNATLFVNAISSKDASSIASATITVANTTIPYSKSALTNAAGVATFANIDPGTYTITATKTGYQSSTTSWPAPAGLVTNAYIGLQPIGATPVPTDPYGNPIYDTLIPTQTYAPGETHDTRTDEEKDADMMNLLRDQGPTLIQFFILCFVIYMIMGIGRGK